MRLTLTVVFCHGHFPALFLAVKGKVRKQVGIGRRKTKREQQVFFPLSDLSRSLIEKKEWTDLLNKKLIQSQLFFRARSALN